MTGIITWIHFFIFYIAISSVYQEVNWKHFFRALAVSTIVLLGFSYLGPDGFNLSSLLPSGGSLLTNNTKSGMYYVLVFFISFIGLSLEKHKKWRFGYIFILVAIFFSPELFNNDILSGNVSAGSILEDPTKLLGMARSSTVVLWLGMIVSGALYIIHKIKQAKIKTRLALGGVVFLLALYGVVFSALLKKDEKMSSILTPNSISSRLIVWDKAVDAIKQNPILGSGPENFDYVYQRFFDARTINLEAGGAWFDRAHNFTLDELSSVGVTGFLITIALFFFVVQMSLRMYREQQKFYFLLIPYIFIFHFIQVQTAFQTITSLFLVFVLFAYLSSQDANTLSISIPAKIKSIIKIAAVPLLLILLYFAVYVPLRQSLMLATLEKSGSFAQRVKIYKENEKSLKSLSISPDQTIQNYVNEYISALAPRVNDIYENELEQAKEEALLYLDLYESYYPKYKDKYKFLLYYGHAINFAGMLGVDKLKQGEDILREALKISQAYPHAYLVLAVNLYNQRRVPEALSYAKEALDLDPLLVKSKEIYETLKTNAAVRTAPKTYLFLSSI